MHTSLDRAGTFFRFHVSLWKICSESSDLWHIGWRSGSEFIKIHTQSLMDHMGSAVTKITPQVTWCVNLVALHHSDDGSEEQSWI